MRTQAQPQPLIDRIRDIGHPEAIRRFFGLLKELIDIVNLPNGDTRLSFTCVKTREAHRQRQLFYRPYAVLDLPAGEIEYWLTIKKSCREQLDRILDEVILFRSAKNQTYVSVIIGQVKCALVAPSGHAQMLGRLPA